MQSFLVKLGKNKELSSIKYMNADGLFEILEEIKRADQDYSDGRVRNKGAPGKSKRLIKEGVIPETLFTKLGESLIEQKEYYIKTFLPALLQEITQSKKLGPEKIEQVLKITLDIVKQSSEEEYKSLFSNLEAKITESIKLSSEEKIERKKIIMELKILNDLSKIVAENQDNNIIRNQSYENLKINDKEELEKPIEAPKFNDCSSSRTRSPVLNEQNLPQSQVSSRSDSISSLSNYVEGDNDLQREEFENQTQLLKQDSEEEPRKQEHENLDSQANPIGNGNSQKRNEDQPSRQLTKAYQNMQESENSDPTKQSNNRNFLITSATGCTFSAIGCFIVGVVTLRTIGAELFVISIVFAILAVVTWHLTHPSSKLIYTDLSPLVGESKQL